MPRLPNPRWDHMGWHGDWTYPDPNPPSFDIQCPDDPEALGELLGPDGRTLKVVFPARRLIGFQPPPSPRAP